MEGRFALNEEIEVRLLAPKPLCEANAECDYMVRALTERLKAPVRFRLFGKTNIAQKRLFRAKHVTSILSPCFYAPLV